MIRGSFNDGWLFRLETDPVLVPSRRSTGGWEAHQAGLPLDGVAAGAPPAGEKSRFTVWFPAVHASGEVVAVPAEEDA
ncbi:hypothetical protein AB1484_34890 [Parafrankia sp. FMc6]|uniref:hypothetical protein n=1 Tax=Parafrankia soli TaxID=2599596 RepID=UPI0034D4E2F9